MNVQTLTNAILIVVLIGWVGYRQMVWRPVSIAQMWRFPAIMSLVGVVLIVQQVKPSSLTPLDLAVVAGELVLSLAVGAWMGAIAHFRPLESPVRLGRDNRYTASYESRTGVLGIVLWVLVIGVRVGVDVLASMAGSHLATATGVIFLVFAANRAARTAVFAARLDRHAALAA
ncbi:hypothetical protein [Leifsonia shinshuensis]